MLWKYLTNASWKFLSLKNLGGDRFLGIFKISEEISAKEIAVYTLVYNKSYKNDHMPQVN